MHAGEMLTKLPVPIPKRTTAMYRATSDDWPKGAQQTPMPISVEIAIDVRPLK